MDNFNNCLKASVIRQQSGFTLIELITVIILLSVLSATIIPTFFGKNSFSEHAYRTDVIAKLRLIQTRAMQQSNVKCHEVVIVKKKLGKGNCSGLSFVNPVNDSEYRGTVVSIASNDPVEFSPANIKFGFDHMGRPYTNNGNQAITIKIIGEQSLSVLIESEGYIHAN